MRITHVIGLPSTIGLLKAPITMSKIEERLHLAQFRCEKFSTLSLLIPSGTTRELQQPPPLYGSTTKKPNLLDCHWAIRASVFHAKSSTVVYNQVTLSFPSNLKNKLLHPRPHSHH
jgi:hypothetical protein